MRPPSNTEVPQYMQNIEGTHADAHVQFNTCFSLSNLRMAPKDYILHNAETFAAWRT